MLIEGSGTDAAGTIWDQAERVVSTRLARVEARAALAQAARIGRISPRQLESSKHELDGLLIQPDLVDVDDNLVRRAGDLAESRALRAYDAVPLAAAQRVIDDDLVMVAGDRALLTAAEAIGMAIATVG